jgi:SOS-response transcriptional repressor LexA
MVTETVISAQEDSHVNFLDMTDENKYGDAFSRALKDKRVKPAVLARELGVGPQRINHWKKRGVSAKYAAAVAAILGTRAAVISNLEEVEEFNIEDLGVGSFRVAEPPRPYGNTRPGPTARGYVPLISWVQAGEWSEAIDLYQPGEAEEVIPCPAPHSLRSFALRVDGDSMTATAGKSYPHGSIIFVDPEQRGGVRPGDRIIAKLKGDDQVTFKQLAEDREGFYLKPLNSNHQPIYGEFTVLGKVIGKWEPE